MTRDEAIKWLIKPVVTSTEIGEIKAKELEAYDIAIEALSEPQSDDLIIKGAKGIKDGLYNIKDGKLFQYKANGGTVRSYQILSEPSIVRCKDCKYIDCCTRTVGLTRHFDGFREYRSEIIDFCSYGERREP